MTTIKTQKTAVNDGIADKNIKKDSNKQKSEILVDYDEKIYKINIFILLIIYANTIIKFKIHIHKFLMINSYVVNKIII